MRFRVTRHSGSKPPRNALELLGERLPPPGGDIAFSKRGGEIRVRLDRGGSGRMTERERTDLGREAVLEVISEICSRSPELELGWFAVSPAG